jgi:glutamate-1-semialdehyde 2,1-aminomutase
MRTAPPIDRSRLEGLLARELERFAESNPRSLELFERAKGSLLGGVPMSWMAKWAGGFPLFLREATGARVGVVDAHR